MSTTPGGEVPARSSSTTVVAFVALYVFWGSTYLGSKFAMASFPPALLSGIRFIIAGLAMAAILFACYTTQGCMKKGKIGQDKFP